MLLVTVPVKEGAETDMSFALAAPGVGVGAARATEAEATTMMDFRMEECILDSEDVT
jgi:hypothetical protein